MALQQVSFVERSSLSQRVSYRRFYCTLNTLAVSGLHQLLFKNISLPLVESSSTVHYSTTYILKGITILLLNIPQGEESVGRPYWLSRCVDKISECYNIVVVGLQPNTWPYHERSLL